MNDPHKDKLAIHGMLLVGEHTPYLSHLPMFASPHNYHAIFEVALSKQGSEPLAVYARDRRAHPQFKMYSMVPNERFILTDLVTLGLGSPHRPVREAFSGQIWRGHFEASHKHEKQGSTIPKLHDVVAQVVGVTLFRQLPTFAQSPPQLPHLEYYLFGKTQELFLAHVITQPPDFDQVLGVRVEGYRFTDDELRHGLLVYILERRNSQSQKLEAQEQIGARIMLPSKGGYESLSVRFRVETQYYFETDDLASARRPTHV